MRFLYTFVTLSCAAIVSASDAQTVRGDIAKLSSLMENLGADTKLVKPGSLGIAQALQVESDAVDVHKLLVKAADDANASPPFGSSSFSIGLDFIQLQPKVKKTLEGTAAQKDAFGELGLVVLSSLYQLQADTKKFGQAVTEKLGLLEKSLAPAIIKDINESFNKAIVAYAHPVSRSHVGHYARGIYELEGKISEADEQNWYPTTWKGPSGWSKARFAYWIERLEWIRKVTALERLTRKEAADAASRQKIVLRRESRLYVDQ
ncbi:hypothetical protein EsDP_00005304 [Epichloe bromicola]|uniref:Uncharacterized protein n=1 Tax=Epichloe bromicola TaxID=79588 RepID=A0ABQ0CUC7_9HYPO